MGLNHQQSQSFLRASDNFFAGISTYPTNKIVQVYSVLVHKHIITTIKCPIAAHTVAYLFNTYKLHKNANKCILDGEHDYCRDGSNIYTERRQGRHRAKLRCDSF